jgi:hypothetical protein
MVLMPSWCNFDSVALILGTILWTIDLVYLQLPAGNPLMAELRASQSEQWLILYPMTSVACAFPPLGGDCHVGWLHRWDNLRTTRFALKCMRSEQGKWYVMPKQCMGLYTFLTTSTKSRFEASHSWGACWFGKMNAGPFCVRKPTKQVEPRNCRNTNIYIPSVWL